MPTERRLAEFEGLWHVTRRISQADGGAARFEGTARFAPSTQGGLDYVEEGQLHLDGAAPLHATRRYHWAEGLVVTFADGRPFHTVPPAGGEAHHLCPPDDYVVAYDFTAWPEWRATWTVRGPRKDYRMVSTYRRGDAVAG